MQVTAWGGNPIVLTSWQKLALALLCVWRILVGSDCTIVVTCDRCQSIDGSRRCYGTR